MKEFRLRVALVLLILPLTQGCSWFPKSAKILLDQQFSLQRGEIRAVPIEIDQPAEMRLEVSNLDGQPLFSYLINRADRTALEAKQEWRYYTVFSEPALRSRFDSGWRKIAGPAVYNLILSPYDKDVSAPGTPPQGATLARVHVEIR